MKKTTIIKLILIFLLKVNLFSLETNYLHNEETSKLIKDLVKNHGFNKTYLNRLFSSVKVQKSALKYYTQEKKKDFEIKKKYHGSWDRYEKKLLNQERIDTGAKFMKKNKEALNKAYKKYGVQPEYIAAIIGIESFYGKYSGDYPVFDALATLSFEKNRRNEFFKNELKEFLILTKKNNQNPKNIYGSFAGAIGLAQFMPSNFKKLAIDFNNDGVVDLDNEEDAIGSVAKYFNKSGWDRMTPVATRVSYEGKRFDKLKTGFKYKYKRSKLKGIKPKDDNFFYPRKVHLIKLNRYKFDELWYGTKNFYVITRYNRSNYYAMAVYKLAKKLRKAYRKKSV
ncbi:lytic murein transglycosylase B [Arcobacter arenosus]|uniref:Lytic murein transglycosylase B n=1 Tax=Arcobacter arenosus TaxID=2576037 RepID=A0A5R8Y3B5_9BACT|nr:lytic murein transglycosylase B [Arcobacter arenosus]TLP40565.1 lytic murein transglycosylase B [Arcobacter arenosus]